MLLLATSALSGQLDSTITAKTTDVVWLKDGSKLQGKIIKWDLHRGMEFQLVTGATLQIPKGDIKKVTQDMPFNGDQRNYDNQYVHQPRPYAFREVGWYHTTSGFVNTSINGGAGIHHAMGYRFSRYLGLGLGIGIESNDLDRARNIIPVYAELRGFLMPKKITPYYALKLGYGFALRDALAGTIEAKGGIHISPEVGIRFGGRDVNYYFGLEYKLQNAEFTSNDWWTGAGTSTDRISYRRFELRTGILF